MPEQWNHAEERRSWEIGPFTFVARRHNGGWLYWGMYGTEEVMAECYDFDLHYAKMETQVWANSFCEGLSNSIREFEP